MGLTLDDLLAKEEIREVLFRYCRGIDRLDFDLVESCYHPGAYDDHGTYQGDVPGFIQMCKGFLPRFVCTQHFLGNMLIEVDGERARAETYAVAYHRKELADGSGHDDVFGIRYVDRFEKQNGDWKIAHRVVATEWRRVDPVPQGKLRGTLGVWGSRDESDVVNWIMDAGAAR